MIDVRLGSTREMAWMLALAAGLGGAARLWADDQPAQVPPASDSQGFDQLDAELFEDLQRDLERDLPAAAPAGQMPEDTPAEPDAESPAADPDEATHPLAQVGQRMRQAQHQLGQRQVGEATQAIQQRIVADLEQLLRQMNRRKQGGGSSSQESPEQQASRRSQTQPNSGGQPGGNGQGAADSGPARDSTDQLRQQTPEQAAAERQELLKDLWGHLPERVREQMLQASMDQFLPKYQLLLEEYFKRLVRSRRGSDD